MAIKTLSEEYGIDASGYMPSDARYIGLSSYDLFVALDGDVAEVIEIPSCARFESWMVDDPYGRPDEYIACSRLIVQKLKD